MGSQRVKVMEPMPTTVPMPIKAASKAKRRKGKKSTGKAQKVVVIVKAQGKPDHVTVERNKQTPPVQPQPDEKAIRQQLRNQYRISGRQIPRITSKMPKLR